MQSHGHPQGQSQGDTHGMKQVIEPKSHTDPTGTNLFAVVSLYIQTHVRNTISGGRRFCAEGWHISFVYFF